MTVRYSFLENAYIYRVGARLSPQNLLDELILPSCSSEWKQLIIILSTIITNNNFHYETSAFEVSRSFILMFSRYKED